MNNYENLFYKIDNKTSKRSDKEYRKCIVCQKDFWIKKIESNIERDKTVNEKLKDNNWTVLRFWGKEIEKNLEKCIETIECTIRKKRDLHKC
jgi:DNA mismatch endonuclease (patch repair protein)